MNEFLNDRVVHSIILIAVMALITYGLRVLPFLVFGKRETPKFVIYLSKVLPYAIMGMLVVFCFKNVKVTSFPHGIPELIAGVITVVLHAWKRNTLISILFGTVSYMLLVQLVF